MQKLARVIVVVAVLATIGLGIATMSAAEPTACPLPDPVKVEKCPQFVLQPWRCGTCLYLNKCFAAAAGWNVNRNCESAIGSTPPTPTRP